MEVDIYSASMMQLDSCTVCILQLDNCTNYNTHSCMSIMTLYPSCIFSITLINLHPWCSLIVALHASCSSIITLITIHIHASWYLHYIHTELDNYTIITLHHSCRLIIKLHSSCSLTITRLVLNKLVYSSTFAVCVCVLRTFLWSVVSGIMPVVSATALAQCHYLRTMPQSLIEGPDRRPW